jgi:hypothetical protein
MSIGTIVVTTVTMTTTRTTLTSTHEITTVTTEKATLEGKPSTPGDLPTRLAEPKVILSNDNPPRLTSGQKKNRRRKRKALQKRVAKLEGQTDEHDDKTKIIVGSQMDSRDASV